MLQVLPKNFFQENPLKPLSSALLVHTTMNAEIDEALTQLAYEHGYSRIEPSRMTKIDEERETISRIGSAEALVKFMRGEFDIFNRRLVCHKAAQLLDDVAPLILRRYYTSVQDEFIETAIQILACGDIQYAEQLKENYANIRDAYAQSVACILFGERGFQEQTPLLLAEYRRFQREYPEEKFEQGPLLALYLLNGKL